MVHHERPTLARSFTRDRRRNVMRVDSGCIAVIDMAISFEMDLELLCESSLGPVVPGSGEFQEDGSAALPTRSEPMGRQSRSLPDR